MSNQDAINAINRVLGKGAVLTLEDLGEPTETISFGNKAIDDVFCVGGIPTGTLVELFGYSQSGKTTLTYHLMAGAQKKGYSVLFMDYEQAFDVSYAKVCGLDISKDKFYMAQPGNFEDGYEIISQFIEKGDVKLIVVDSLATMQPKSVLEAEMGEQQYPSLARMMKQALINLLKPLADKNVTLVFINHLQEVLGGQSFIKQTTTPGGKALKYYSTIRVEVTRCDFIKDGDNKIGQNVRINVLKNKKGCPYKQVTVPLIFGKGFDSITSSVVLAIAKKVIKKINNSQYELHNGDKVTGIQNVYKIYKEKPELLKALDGLLVLESGEEKIDAAE